MAGRQSGQPIVELKRNKVAELRDDHYADRRKVVRTRRRSGRRRVYEDARALAHELGYAP